MQLSPAVAKFLVEQKYCVARSLVEQEKDAYKLTLRQGQRKRRKERKNALV